MNYMFVMFFNFALSVFKCWLTKQLDLFLNVCLCVCVCVCAIERERERKRERERQKGGSYL